MNEFLLILSLVLLFSLTVLAYRFFGKAGLYGMTVFATLSANIEVLFVIEAFGLEQTLGNVLFAVTFLVTDILSENESKKAADRAVLLGVATSVLFLCVTQLWMVYTPSANDLASEHIRSLFARTPRVLLASLAVYAVTQWLDVRLYHAIWQATTDKCGDGKRFLWLRNNAATLISQLVNTILFNIAAFAGTYPVKTVVSIILSGYAVFIVTSLADTPAAYAARRLKEKGKIPE